MENESLKLSVRFFRTSSGAEPVRKWLKELTDDQKKAIGEDIKTAQYGWPVGMPLIRKLDMNLWEVRTRMPEGIARVIFTVAGNTLILLHGFIKKSQKIPQDEITTAKTRMKQLKETGL
jgi:phage-related protein